LVFELFCAGLQRFQKDLLRVPTWGKAWGKKQLVMENDDFSKSPGKVMEFHS
jgi:hypothetical protein